MIKLLGVIPTQQAIYDEDGELVSDAVYDDSNYYAMSHGILEGLTPVEPNRPLPRFASGCYYYAFSDESDAKNQLGHSVDDDGNESFSVVERKREPVPKEITRRQGKQMLALVGKLDDVQPAIDAISDTQQRTLTQIFWDESNMFERENPYLIGMAQALNMTDEQLDDLFIEAAKL